MRKLILVVATLLFSSTAFCQTDVEVKLLIEEGISLHDKGDYEAAISKFDAALVKDPASFGALFEKANTLTSLKRYDECIGICQKMIKGFAYEKELKNVYVMYGSAVDYKDDPEGAIKIYDEGIKKFPDYYLLYFNKAITQQSTDKFLSAYTNYQLALTYNHFHASSWLHVAELLKKANKIPSYMALLMQLISEPDGKRAKVAYQNMQDLFSANVSTDGDKKTINISMDPSMLDKKEKKVPDNFSSTEFMFVLSSALDFDSAHQAKTVVERLQGKLETLIASISLNKSQKGFFTENVVPFLSELKKNEHTETLARLVLASQGDERNDAWLKTHEEKISAFYKWAEGFKWPEK